MKSVGPDQPNRAKKKIAFISGVESRHAYFASALSRLGDIDLALWISSGDSARVVSEKSLDDRLLFSHDLARRQFDHLLSLATFTDGITNIRVKPDNLSAQDTVDVIKGMELDLIISFGCPLIRPPLLNCFKGSFINIHFGLSPYYRGAATNVWPLINGDFACLGVTFMLLDAGVDTGAIVHQERIQPLIGDSCHTIGLRSLAVALSGIKKLLAIPDFSTCPSDFFPESPRKLVRIADFDAAAVARLYRETYGFELSQALENWDNLQDEFPIFNGCG